MFANSIKEASKTLLIVLEVLTINVSAFSLKYKLTIHSLCLQSVHSPDISKLGFGKGCIKLQHFNSISLLFGMRSLLKLDLISFGVKDVYYFLWSTTRKKHELERNLVRTFKLKQAAELCSFRLQRFHLWQVCSFNLLYQIFQLIHLFFRELASINIWEHS